MKGDIIYTSVLQYIKWKAERHPTEEFNYQRSMDIHSVSSRNAYLLLEKPEFLYSLTFLQKKNNPDIFDFPPLLKKKIQCYFIYQIY